MAKKEVKETSQLQDALDKVTETLRDAEESVTAGLKEVGERLHATQVEAKRRVDSLLESFNTEDLSERLDLKTNLDDLKAGFENRLENSQELLWAKLGLATKADLDATNRKLAALTKKLAALEGPEAKSGKKPSRRAEA